MRKIFASDFDGTLYFWDAEEHLSPRDLEAITTFQEAGGLVGLCTGRPLRALTKQVPDLIPFDFYIALSGATIFDRAMRPLFYRSIPEESFQALLAQIEQGGVDPLRVLVCADDDYFCLQGRETRGLLVPVASFDEVPRPVIGLAMALPTAEEAARLAARINECHGDTLQAFQNLSNVDIVAAGCSKGEGMRFVSEHFKADLTAGMGDSFNDVPMLDAADVAYTFPTVAPDVQAHADVLVRTAAEAIADFAARR